MFILDRYVSLSIQALAGLFCFVLFWVLRRVAVRFFSTDLSKVGTERVEHVLAHKIFSRIGQLPKFKRPIPCPSWSSQEAFKFQGSAVFAFCLSAVFAFCLSAVFALCLTTHLITVFVTSDMRLWPKTKNLQKVPRYKHCVSLFCLKISQHGF